MLRYDKHATLDEMAQSLKDEYISLHATVIEQQAEIERLREALGILWSWCRNWDAEFIYDDEFDRSAIESLLGATQ